MGKRELVVLDFIKDKKVKHAFKKILMELKLGEEWFMKKVDINIDEYQDAKTSLVDVETLDGEVHRSFVTNDGKVLYYEDIPENYPSWSIGVFDSVTEYYNEIRKIKFIMDCIPNSSLEIIEEYADGENK